MSEICPACESANCCFDEDEDDRSWREKLGDWFFEPTMWGLIFSASLAVICCLFWLSIFAISRAVMTFETLYKAMAG